MYNGDMGLNSIQNIYAEQSSELINGDNTTMMRTWYYTNMR